MFAFGIGDTAVKHKNAPVNKLLKGPDAELTDASVHQIRSDIADQWLQLTTFDVAANVQRAWMYNPPSKVWPY